MCGSFPFLSAPHSLFSNWADLKRSEKIPIWTVLNRPMYNNYKFYVNENREKKSVFFTKRDKDASQRNLSGHRDNRFENGTVPVKTGRLVTLPKTIILAINREISKCNKTQFQCPCDVTNWFLTDITKCWSTGSEHTTGLTSSPELCLRCSFDLIKSFILRGYTSRCAKSNIKANKNRPTRWEPQSNKSNKSSGYRCHIQYFRDLWILLHLLFFKHFNG